MKWPELFEHMVIFALTTKKLKIDSRKTIKEKRENLETEQNRNVEIKEKMKIKVAKDAALKAR